MPTSKQIAGLVFSPRAEFFDVEGIPVSLSANVPGVPLCAAWDDSPPRKFDPGSMRRNGAPISETAFRAMLEEMQTRPSARFPAGTEFFDVDETPVARLPDGKCVFSNGKPFPNPAKVFSFGGRISAEEFDRLDKLP
jgi:hypothetical protein